MIRVAIVDDHHAIRVGLHTLLRAEPGITPVGTAGRAEEVAPLLRRTSPDVVLLDYHLPGTDGLAVCRRITSAPPAPAVLLYSAFADESLAMPALVAGAHGMVDKCAPASELLEAVHRVGRGERVMPALTPALVHDAAIGQDAADLPILGMLADDCAPREIAGALCCNVDELNGRIARILARMRGQSLAA